MHQLTQEVCAALVTMGKNFRPPKWDGSFAASDVENWNELLAVYDSLEDEESKKTFTKLVIFRLAWVLLPQDIAINEYGFYSKDEWKQFEEKAKLIDYVTDDYIFDRIETWVLKGYEYNDCCVHEGDVVLECGAFTGNTALYFSQLAGDSGAVYAFEPCPETYEKLCGNVKEYTNIIPVRRGLAHEESILRFSFVEGNSAANRFSDNGEIELRVCTIDNFVEEKKLEKVDFIKMDIEGYEGNALRGAASVIQKYKPKLAICIYHKPEDIFAIQRQIHEICDEYTFYVKHNSMWLQETVLFCVPIEGKRALPVVSSHDHNSIMTQILNMFLAQWKPISKYTRSELTKILLARHKERLQASCRKRAAKFMRSCQKRRIEIAAKYQAWQESKKK